MPQATINPNHVERKDLKSLPEGYVVLRRLTYGQLLDRQSDAMQMEMSGQSDKKDSPQAAIRLMGRKTAQLEFATCIVEHNLEDDKGQPLNFSNPKTLDVLDPRVGEEIGKYINEMNRFEEEVGNFGGTSDAS